MKTPRPETMRVAAECLQASASKHPNSQPAKRYRLVADWLEHLSAHVELEATVQECVKAMKKLCPGTREEILEFHIRQALRDGQT